jgi:carbon-monoxide dehydrogenase small subunit
MTRVTINLTVNGKALTAEVEPRWPLVEFLRDHLRLTGTHVGNAMRSCTVFAVQADGCDVKTIEGVSSGNALHPMQKAFHENHALQCGFCTPGMIMSALDLVRREGYELSEETIRHNLEGNICRCTGYYNIVKAVAAGARAMRADVAI